MDMGEKTVCEITKADFLELLNNQGHKRCDNPDGSVSYVFGNCIIMRFVSITGRETFYKQEVIQ